MKLMLCGASTAILMCFGISTGSATTNLPPRQVLTDTSPTYLKNLSIEPSKPQTGFSSESPAPYTNFLALADDNDRFLPTRMVLSALITCSQC